MFISHCYHPRARAETNKLHSSSLFEQAYLLWVSVSSPFTTEDLESESAPVVEGDLIDLGYEVSGPGHKFSEKAARNRAHARLRVLRIWHHGTLAPLTFSRFPPRKLDQDALETYIIPVAGEPSVSTKLREFISRTIPANGK